MIAMNPTIQINDRHDWTKMGNSSSCLVAPYAKLMKMISGSACQRCHVKKLAVSMRSFREWATGLTSYGGEKARIEFLFILLAGQCGPRECIVYGKQIQEAGNDGE